MAGESARGSLSSGAARWWSSVGTIVAPKVVEEAIVREVDQRRDFWVRIMYGAPGEVGVGSVV